MRSQFKEKYFRFVERWQLPWVKNDDERRKMVKWLKDKWNVIAPSASESQTSFIYRFLWSKNEMRKTNSHRCEVMTGRARAQLSWTVTHGKSPVSVECIVWVSAADRRMESMIKFEMDKSFSTVTFTYGKRITFLRSLFHAKKSEPQINATRKRSERKQQQYLPFKHIIKMVKISAFRKGREKKIEFVHCCQLNKSASPPFHSVFFFAGRRKDSSTCFFIIFIHFLLPFENASGMKVEMKRRNVCFSIFVPPWKWIQRRRFLSSASFLSDHFTHSQKIGKIVDGVERSFSRAKRTDECFMEFTRQQQENRQKEKKRKKNLISLASVSVVPAAFFACRTNSICL